MALARPTRGLKALNATKRYILSTLLATIAMAGLIIFTFVILSPARIKISVVHGGRHQLANGSVAITFTLAANNTSRRAAVVYKGMFVDLFWEQSQGCSIDNVTPEMPLLQPPGAVTTFQAQVKLDDKHSLWVQWLNSNKTGIFTLMVVAEVWFKVGVARTRKYDIMVSCGPADFFNQHRIGTYPVDCA